MRLLLEWFLTDCLCAINTDAIMTLLPLIYCIAFYITV